MDAVAEMRSTCEHTLEEWARDGQTLFRTAKDLGVDTSRVADRLSGTLQMPAGVKPPARATRRRGTGRRAGSNGHGPTSDQILQAIIDLDGANVSQLARKLGITRQTMAKKLAPLAAEGLVTPRGEGSRRTWHPVHAGK